MTAALIDAMAALPAAVWVLLVIGRTRRGAGSGALVRATIEAVAVSFVLAHANRWIHFWPSHPNFPSGHETFATCMSVSVLALERRTLPLWAALLAILGYALVRAGWHGRFEVIGGFLLGALVMAVALKVNRVLQRTA